MFLASFFFENNVLGKFEYIAKQVDGHCPIWFVVPDLMVVQKLSRLYEPPLEDNNYCPSFSYYEGRFTCSGYACSIFSLIG